MIMKNILATALIVVLAASVNGQTLKLPALSPTSTVSQEFSTSKIDITYSRPSKRDRKIFGGLVPYNEVWRTGANASTKLTFGEEVEIGGKTIKAGTYSFYTVPGEKEWEVILNTQTGNWGAFGYAKEDDVLRMKVKPQMINGVVETFTIDINNITFNSCTIDLYWDNVMVSVPVKANNNDRIMKDIEQHVEKPRIPYRQAALYYYETGQNLEKAYEYTQKAIEENPKAYWNHLLKAQIAVKLGKKDAARESAMKAREITKGTEAENSYMALTQEVLDQLGN
jgi:hypothetical protein